MRMTQDEWQALLAEKGAPAVKRLSKDLEADPDDPTGTLKQPTHHPLYRYTFADGSTIEMRAVVDEEGNATDDYEVVAPLKQPTAKANKTPTHAADLEQIRDPNTGRVVKLRDPSTGTVIDLPDPASSDADLKFGNRIVRRQPDGTYKEVFADEAGQARDNAQTALSNSREERLVQAQETQRRAQEAANALATRRMELDQIVASDRSKLEWAQMEYQKDWNEVKRLSDEARLQLDQAKEQNDVEAGLRADETTRRGQDLSADAQRRGQDLGAEGQRRGQDLSLAERVGSEATSLARDTMKGLAPAGSAQDLAALREGITSGKPVTTPARAMGMPFDPATFTSNVVASALAKFSPHAASLAQGPAPAGTGFAPPAGGAPPAPVQPQPAAPPTGGAPQVINITFSPPTGSPSGEPPRIGAGPSTGFAG